MVCALLVASCVAGAGGGEAPIAAQSPRSAYPGYEPTPMEVVEAMLRLADVTPADVVYDLGCGDGRIVIMAARRFGARGLTAGRNSAASSDARHASAAVS